MSNVIQLHPQSGSPVTETFLIIGNGVQADILYEFMEAVRAFGAIQEPANVGPDLLKLKQVEETLVRCGLSLRTVRSMVKNRIVSVCTTKIRHHSERHFRDCRAELAERNFASAKTVVLESRIFNGADSVTRETTIVFAKKYPPPCPA